MCPHIFMPMIDFLFLGTGFTWTGSSEAGSDVPRPQMRRVSDDAPKRRFSEFHKIYKKIQVYSMAQLLSVA